MDVSEALRDGPARPGAWERRTLQSWDPLSVLVLVVVGALAGAVLILAAPRGAPIHREFITSDGFGLWLVTICAQTAFWAVVAGPLWREIIDLHRASCPPRRLLALPALIAASVVILLLVRMIVTGQSSGSESSTPPPPPLWGLQAKMGILTLFGLVGVGLPALYAIALVQDRVRRHSPGQVTLADLTIAVVARDYIRRYLALAGGAVGLAVVATGALRRAGLIFNSSDEQDVRVISSENVLLYGAFFTALLLVVYVPAHLTLHRLCVDLRDYHFPVASMPPPSSSEFKEWFEGRQRLDTVTQANVTPFQQLQSSLFILTPLLTGVLAALLPDLN